MRFAIVLVHLMGNPSLPTSEPVFTTIEACQQRTHELNAGPARLWSYVCERVEK